MKIIIIYASAGAGHRKAAEAIREALVEETNEKDVLLVDSLEHANRFFSWMYGKKYITLVNYMPLVWGFFYYLLDNSVVYRIIGLPRRIINALNCRRLEEFLLRQRPDVVVTTHFMANEIVSRLKKAGRLNCRLYSAVTDYKLHSFWVTPGVDRYFVATQITKADLINRGVNSNNIEVTGMPVSPRFGKAQDKTRMRLKLGLRNELFTALIIGGGFGVGPVEALVREISAASKAVQFIIVCGYNKKLQEKISGLVSSLRVKAKVYGFVDNIHELMSASDILITKSGGLTASEAAVKGLPMIFIRPIPGQESRNSRVFGEYKAAFVARDAQDVAARVKILIENPSGLDEMRLALKAIAKVDSATRIAQFVLAG